MRRTWEYQFEVDEFRLIESRTKPIVYFDDTGAHDAPKSGDVVLVHELCDSKLTGSRCFRRITYVEHVPNTDVLVLCIAP